MPRKVYGGLNRNGTLRSSTIKKVDPPKVPDIANNNVSHNRLSCYSTTSSSSNSSGASNSSGGSSCETYESEPVYQQTPFCIPSPDNGTMKHLYNPGVHLMLDANAMSVRPRSHPGTPQSPSPQIADYGLTNNNDGNAIYISNNNNTTLVFHQQVSPNPLPVTPNGYPGGDVRNSSSSLDSGRGSTGSSSEASSFGSNKEPFRISLACGSAGSATSLSMSSCSSSSSSDASSPKDINVASLLLSGIRDREVLGLWLKNLHFEEYQHLFLEAGYDMPTISRMTPEDLRAIGITIPHHRRRLKLEISKLNISDGIPDYKPDNLLLWLKLLRLDQYAPALSSQGYTTIDKVAELTWEDLEEIGIQKLGHQKKLMLAIKKVKGQKGLYGALPVPPTATVLGSSNNNPSAVQQQQPQVSRYQSLDMGNPHARPITVPVPPNQYEALNQPGRMQSFLNNRGTLRTLGSGSDLQRLDNEDQQLYSSLEMNNQKNQRAQGRSLESLQNDMLTFQSQDWRSNSFSTEHNYEPIEGTATLNRPRGLVKPRPVAKVTGTSTTSLRDTINDEDEDNLKMPPKRILPSIAPAKPPLGDTMADTAFATCVQSLTSRFTLATQDKEDKDDTLPAVPPPMNATLRSISRINQITNQVNQKHSTSRVDELNKANSEQKTPPTPPQRDYPATPSDSSPGSPLSSSQVAQVHRQDSSSSLTSDCGIPFANENVGTIKQKPPNPPAPDYETPTFESCTLPRRGTPKVNVFEQTSTLKKSFADSPLLRRSQSARAREIDANPPPPPPAPSTGHKVAVIDDIEHMLASLTDQLDAMLDHAA